MICGFYLSKAVACVCGSAWEVLVCVKARIQCWCLLQSLFEVRSLNKLAGGWTSPRNPPVSASQAPGYRCSQLCLYLGAGDQPQVLMAAPQGPQRLRRLLALCCQYLGTQLSLAHDTVWSHSLVIIMSVTFCLKEDPAGNSDQMFSRGSQDSAC